MARQIVAVYMSDTILRTVMAEGKQIREWGELPFEPGLVENNVIVNVDAVAEKIKELLNVQAVSTRRVIVGISGMRCFTRPILLPRLPGEILDEAVRREAERTLPVPLDELYLSWQTIPAPEGNTQVFLTAIPRRTVDPLVSVFNQVGLRPSFVDLKPLLLARVTREETVIIVDVQETEFDIVIMREGVPQPIRTVPFPEANLTWLQKLPVIRDELDRTITFYNSNNPENAIEPDIPVYVSGTIGDEGEFCRRLSEEINRSVLLLSSPLEVPEDFESLPYMANIGLVLQETTSGRRNGPSVVNLNALPAIYRPQPISSLNILKLLGAAFAFILLIALVFVIQNVSSTISSERDSLEFTRTLLQQGQTSSTEMRALVNDLESELEKLETGQQNFTAALGNLELQSLGLNRDIEVTMDSAPSSVTLTNVTHDNGILTISGIAPSEKTVLTYYESLDDTGRFSDIEIQEMTGMDDGRMEFTLVGSLLIDTKWVSSMEVILGNLPSVITLVSAGTDGSALTLTGDSPDEDRLLIYLEKLDASGKFSEITITSMTRTEDGGMDFTVVLRMGE